MPRPGVSEPPPRPAPQSRTTTVSSVLVGGRPDRERPRLVRAAVRVHHGVGTRLGDRERDVVDLQLGGAGLPRERGDVGPELAHLVRRRGRPALVAMLDDDGPLCPHGYWQGMPVEPVANREGLLTCDRARGPGRRSSRRSSSTWRCMSVRARFAWRRPQRPQQLVVLRVRERERALRHGDGAAEPVQLRPQVGDLAHEPRRAGGVRDQQVQHRVAPRPRRRSPRCRRRAPRRPPRSRPAAPPTRARPRAPPRRSRRPRGSRRGPAARPSSAPAGRRAAPPRPPARRRGCGRRARAASRCTPALRSTRQRRPQRDRRDAEVGRELRLRRQAVARAEQPHADRLAEARHRLGDGAALAQRPVDGAARPAPGGRRRVAVSMATGQTSR